MCQTLSENQIDIINSCLNNVISLPLKRTVFREFVKKYASRRTLQMRHQGGLSIVPSCCFTSGYAKRLSLALNILPRRLFLLLLFSSFATDT